MAGALPKAWRLTGNSIFLFRNAGHDLNANAKQARPQWGLLFLSIRARAAGAERTKVMALTGGVAEITPGTFGSFPV